jgi:hypothetical protein
LLSDECPVVGILPVRKMVVEILEIVGALMLLLRYHHVFAICVAKILVRMLYSHDLFILKENRGWRAI